MLLASGSFRRPVDVDVLCDSDGLEALLQNLADQIQRGRLSTHSLALVGVRTRGVPLAERIAEILLNKHRIEGQLGAVDTTLYRDDLEHSPRRALLRGTDIPFDVENLEVVLVDDVLNTGRSVRAALNTVCDLGRPARVRLAVVVDRGGRELPIQAEYVGIHCEARPGERIVVRIPPVDECAGIERVAADEQT